VKSKILVVGFSSLPGGGKDYIADIICERYGFYKVSPGDIIREKMSKMKKGKISREDQQKLQASLRKRYGKDYVMELCLKKIKSMHTNKAAIAGIRFPADIKFFKRGKDISFYNIFVYAPTRLRFERTLERKRIDAPISYNDFINGDKNEKNIFHLDETEKISDFKLNNGENDSKKLYVRIDKILKKIM